MIFRLVSKNEIKIFPGWWQEGDTIYTNAEAERRALESGEWHHLVVDEQPEYNPETQYLDYYYELVEDTIHQRFTVKEIEE